MKGETRIELTERRAIGYGPDEEVVFTIPHDRGLERTDAGSGEDIPKGPLQMSGSQGRRELTWWCGEDIDSGAYQMTALWIPERGQWVGYSRSFTNEGYRGSDESIEGPYYMSDAFTAYVDKCLRSIQEIAYRKWERRGLPVGDPITDWVAAEKEFWQSTAEQVAPAEADKPRR